MSELVGRVLNGAYRVQELLGTGGMADVYKAEQLAPPRRTVALKILKSEYESDAAFVRRFQQEARAVLVLNNDHVVRSFDVGVDLGLHYIVMEYVEGETLKALIRRQAPLSLKEIVQIGAHVLEGLHHAHEHGLIHRDVKPQNILLTTKRRAKLADFGIARLTATDNTQTFSGKNVLGSVHYISPEQARGDAVTVESDIYSMGVTLYEMATGRLPFEGESSVSIAVKHLNEEITPPKVINPKMSTALNDIICKALQKRPENRYHSAKEMRADILRAVREPEGAYARAEEAPVKKAQKRRRKSGKGILRIMAAAFTLIGVFVVLLLMGQPQQRPGESALVETVPPLVGKAVEEAREYAGRRGYTVQVVATVSSDQYPGGYVVSQYPLAKTSLKSGSTIELTVSGGIYEALVPNVKGSLLIEAEATLQEAGLIVGDIEYGLNEAPVGTVYGQSPEANTPLAPGDEVMLLVSGEPSRYLEAPDVTGMQLREAFTLLRSKGFSAFWVRLPAPDQNPKAAKAGEVILQNPVQGEQFSNTDKFTLTISDTALYAADMRMELMVQENDSQLVVTIVCEEDGMAYEMVVWETVLKSGEQELVFTAAANIGGEKQLRLYLNGAQFMEKSAIFSFRG